MVHYLQDVLYVCCCFRESILWPITTGVAVFPGRPEVSLNYHTL